ncbi:MAG: DEAD/DEAH box helicase [Magnetococcales bacterium]|nr:DEAD/DEAH box helicase [Magnetococcales bacterium]
MTGFSSFDLLPPILAAIEEAGYTTPTPIQEQAIPHLREGRDLLGIAQTGTGKTAAFALPILDRLARRRIRPGSRQARALILTPTRELAAQIDASFATYGQRLNLTRAVVYGGVGQYGQVKSMGRGVDILTATPGRLLDLMNQGFVKLDRLEIFVLDEADRMLDMGFIHDIRMVISHLPVERQTLLFSATMPKEIAHLAQGLLSDPEQVETTPPATTVERVEQKVYFVEKGDKRAVLAHLLRQESLTRALVFTRTKHGADKVVEDLQKRSIEADAIHGNKSQGARERALSRFRSGESRVLVATDIAARGIDVSGISHVINFDLPNEPDNYVHRIGRTARAGREGVAISLCDATEVAFLRVIERIIRIPIPVETQHPYHSELIASSPAGSPQPASPSRSGGRPSRPARPSRPPRDAAAPEKTQRPPRTRSEQPKAESAPRSVKPRPGGGASRPGATQGNAARPARAPMARRRVD